MIQPDRTVPTVCPYCGVGCALELHIKDQTIFKVTSPFDAVVNHGNILTTGRLLGHWHGGTLTRHSQLDALFPEPLVDMHEVDAARAGVRTGDVVRVTSRRGSVVLRANVTRKARPGVVFIPMHFAEAAANLLTVDALDPQAKIPEYKACAVTIAHAREEELVLSGANLHV